MRYSIIAFSDIIRNSDFRIDAEYYKKEILNRLNVLKYRNKDVLDNLAEFVVGPFGSTITTDKYINKSNYRYIRNKDISDFFIQDDDPALLSREIYDSLPQFHIQENDLLITVVGTLGKVAIATYKDTESIFSCKSTIIRAKKINPFYLLTYLNSDTGTLFSLRGKRGAIQEGLNLTDLKEIQIFIPSEELQEIIEKTVKTSFLNIEEAKIIYQEAQISLLTELELIDWRPKHQLTFVKNYSDTQQAGRIDAEYFQPKYEEIVHAIKNYSGGWDTLERLVTMKKCVEVGSENYLTEGIPFVRVSNLSPFEITEEKHISEALYENLKKHQPEQGEILFSKDATPGIAYYLREQPSKMIPSGGILRLKSKTDEIDNDYLTLVLNSILTKQQVNRDVGGSVILHWRPDQVQETMIPILPKEKQVQIQQKVTKSFGLRRKSKNLLECAKRAVEMAIEQDEQTAIDWLEGIYSNIEMTG